MASEADLDVDIKALSVLSEHPHLYPEFAELGCVGSLVSLLAHDNTDIAIDSIQILAELTDEDVEAEPEQWDTLVNAMVRSSECCRIAVLCLQFKAGRRHTRITGPEPVTFRRR
jgi:beta-catenin-like protein 1